MANKCQPVAENVGRSKDLNKVRTGPGDKNKLQSLFGPHIGGLINFFVPKVALDKKRLTAGRAPRARTQLES